MNTTHGFLFIKRARKRAACLDHRACNQPSSEDKLLGARICAFRVAAGISQRDLARRLKLSIPIIQRYEAGTAKVPASRLRDIARALAMDPLAISWRSDMLQNEDRDERQLEASDCLLALVFLIVLGLWWAVATLAQGMAH